MNAVTTTDLEKLHAHCNEAHVAYRAARKHLALAVNKPEDSEAIQELIASAQELGLNATLHRLKTDDPNVAQAITQLVEASDVLSLAVGEREAALTELHPGRRRVYVDDGREFTLDMEKGLWTYLDDPKNVIKVKLAKENKLPYELPGFEHPTLDVDVPKKRKKPRIKL